MNFIKSLPFSCFERVFPIKALPYSFFPEEEYLSDKKGKYILHPKKLLTSTAELFVSIR